MGLVLVEKFQSEPEERIDHYACDQVPQRRFTVRKVPRVEVYVVDRLRYRYLEKVRRTESVRTKCSKQLVDSDMIERYKAYGGIENRRATAAPCQYGLARNCFRRHLVLHKTINNMPRHRPSTMLLMQD